MIILTKLVRTEQWSSGQGAEFLVQWSWDHNHKLYVRLSRLVAMGRERDQWHGIR